VASANAPDPNAPKLREPDAQAGLQRERADSGYATASAAMISLALAIVAVASMDQSRASLKAARADAEALQRDIDFDSDDLGLDLSNVIFDPIVFDFNQSLEYNLNLINSIPDDFNNIQIPTLTEIEIINIRLRDPGISNEERQYLTYKLERILNG
jgi:hypothetical protein